MSIHWKDYNTDGLYDELIQSPSRPRKWARALCLYFSSLKDEELKERRTASELAIQAMGITFTVYLEDKGNIDQAWPFDIIPRIITKTEWDKVEKGLKQRVNICRALLSDPPVLLFDEPTSGLDFEMTKELYRLLKNIHDSGKIILFTSHRPEEIRNLATRIIVLHEGNLVFDGSPQQYFESEIHENLYAS